MYKFECWERDPLLLKPNTFMMILDRLSDDVMGLLNAKTEEPLYWDEATNGYARHYSGISAAHSAPGARGAFVV